MDGAVGKSKKAKVKSKKAKVKRQMADGRWQMADGKQEAEGLRFLPFAFLYCMVN